MQVNGQSLEATADPAVTDSVRSQASLSNADIAGQYGSGFGEARGLLNKNDNFDQGLSFGGKAETDAIRSRYMPDYDRAEKQLSIENMKGAQMDHLRNLQIATKAAGMEVEQNKQKVLLKDKIEKANRAARGQVLGTVLGVVGGVVGGIYSAGTATVAGAAAGYAVGSAAGNAIGGS